MPEWIMFDSLGTILNTRHIAALTFEKDDSGLLTATIVMDTAPRTGNPVFYTVGGGDAERLLQLMLRQTHVITAAG